jgi:hypothetical protein
MKTAMNLTSTETINTSFLLSTLNEPCGLTYINPYKLCERCGKEEKNANSLFALPKQCQCSSPKTDLELLQDEVNILKKKVNKLIKQQKEQIQNVFEHCWNHPNWKGEYDIKDMNNYINQNK